MHSSYKRRTHHREREEGEGDEQIASEVVARFTNALREELAVFAPDYNAFVER